MRNSNSLSRKRRLVVLRSAPGPAPTDPSATSLETFPVNHAGDIREFADACQARLPLRLLVTDERSGQAEEVLVEKPYAVIGSAELCDVRLVHPDVSRHHAYLQVLSGHVLCCDLASRTGTHWGQRGATRDWLQPGEPLHIGPFTIRLTQNGAERPRNPPADVQPHRLMVQLSFLNARSRVGQARVSRVRNQVTLTGWGHLCNLRLQHHSVGRVHCSLVWTGSELWVVDLLCTDGTSVNGTPVSYARLDESDELMLGQFQLTIGYGSSAEMSQLVPGNIEEPAAMIVRPAAVAPSLRGANAKGAVPARAVPMQPAVHTPAPLAGFRAPLMPAPAEAPAANGMSDAVAVALMQQFSMMQQQLFDHTQQVLTMMAETFQAAHTRQMDIIREELSRVHDLNRELHELNLRRAASAADGAAAPAAATVPLEVPPPPARPAPVREAPAAPDSPTASVRSPNEEPESAAPAPTPVPVAVNAPHPAAPAKPHAAPAAAPAGGDLHAWLTNRINELEEERSSRWQRIVQMITQGRG